MEVVCGMSDRLALSEIGAYAKRVEDLGFDTLHVPETLHDGLMVSQLALQATTTLRVRTSVILAFVRSPMLVATTAWGMAADSGGRFDLGLGSQIKQNIEGRFSMPFGKPVQRMREYVESVQAIWHSFQTGEKLSYTGEYYTFTRLQPFFNPGPLSVAPPSILLGGVNRGIGRLAGELADIFVTHPTNSNPRYLRELLLPMLDEGGKGERRPHLVTGSMFITGRTAADLVTSRTHYRQIFAFLYTTPAYRRTLELFGWAELGERLQALTRSQAWDQLSEVVTDEVLDTLIPQGTWDELPGVIEREFAGLADGVILHPPTDKADDDRFRAVIRDVRTIAGSS
jgi:probable F420-dependent oxidoreductase